MQFLFYLIAYPFLWIVSRLPFRALYMLSDLIFVIVYYLIGYRKRTVRYNLSKAFPNLTSVERLTIEKKSFRHLCDMFLEMIKTMGISPAEINKRFTFTNLDVYHKLEAEGKSIAILCPHYASYEWVISMNKYINFTGYAIYKKIGNPYFDKLVKKIRSRFQATLITTKETIPTIERNNAAGKPGLYGFASDQSPKASKVYHWTEFFGIKTPVVTGSEMLIKKFDMNVLFLRVTKTGRGYYEASFERLFENPKAVPDYGITDEFMRRVESQIRTAPEYYLWTHKRWKINKSKSKTSRQ